MAQIRKRRQRFAAAAGIIGAVGAFALVPTLRAPADSKFLPDDHVVLKSARDVDPVAGTAVIPLHKGNFNGETVWYILTDASDYGVAHDLNVLYAPKLSNIGIGCPECIQEVTLGKPAGKFNNEATINFVGVPNFAPDRVLTPGPNGFPPSAAKPGAVGDAKYTPFIRIQGSPIIYNAPIVAVGDGPFDVKNHSNTADRVIAIDTKQDDDGPEATMVLARGFDSGQPILYLSTEASDPGAASLERATYVPLLNHAPYVSGDDNIGSARERIFVFINGQTGKDNPNAQGLQYLTKDGKINEGATLANAPQLGSPLNVQGDFPSLDDPRHASAYSPLWDVQLSQWTSKAIADGMDKRQTDENQILNLVGEGDITGPGGAPYGGVFVVNCPPIAFVDKRPSVDLAENVFNR